METSLITPTSEAKSLASTRSARTSRAPVEPTSVQIRSWIQTIDTAEAAIANTYTSLIYHVIFSTRNREPWLAQRIEGRIWQFLGGVARKHRMTALQIGGIEDHVHALIQSPPTIAPSQIAQFLEGESSKWIHEEFLPPRGFAWQDGYSAFTVRRSNIPELVRYIQNQREHHRKKTFQEEYLESLRENNIEYDERYLWG